MGEWKTEGGGERVKDKKKAWANEWVNGKQKKGENERKGKRRSDFENGSYETNHTL